ncbi:MAG: helix-turn-helix transcriptional regulator [Deltaproteobacteria bacterium]|nr:helix-turn-helix transcriptional regulator [Deltaproteobacteria bacterium]
MAKGKKTNAKVREIFKKDFADPEFRVLFDEERARSEIARAVTKARKAAGLTQAELAEKAETKQSVVARLESGHDSRTPSLPLLSKIAAATGRRLVLDFEEVKKKTG